MTSVLNEMGCGGVTESSSCYLGFKRITQATLWGRVACLLVAGKHEDRPVRRLLEESSEK